MIVVVTRIVHEAVTHQVVDEESVEKEAHVVPDEEPDGCQDLPTFWRGPPSY